jgi:hypothetical protein
VGKAARRREKKVWVEDAVHFLQMANSIARGDPDLDDRFKDPEQLRSLRGVLDVWRSTPVLLRADPTLVEALLDSDADVALDANWLDQCRLPAFAVTFPHPITVTSTRGPVEYLGWFCVGERSFEDGDQRGVEIGPHISIQGAEGVYCVWIYRAAGLYVSHTTHFGMRGPQLPCDWPETLAGLIAYHQQRDSPATDDQLSKLTTLGILTPLYLAIPHPDLDWLPDHRVARPQQLGQTRIANLGWRVGADLRADAEHRRSNGQAPGRGGWRTTPHIRSGHTRRVRVAERDAGGAITGNLRGQYGIDWHYELRTISPVTVNADLDASVPPAIRRLQHPPDRDPS